MKLLLVEDSEALSHAVRAHLSRDGYSIDCAVDGAAALGFLQGYDYDAIVLDLMLPKTDGLAVLREFRQRRGTSPVLVLSARDQVADRVQALDAGADDYLIKPFSLDELSARLRALLRRPAQPLATTLRSGALEVDVRTRCARWNGSDLQLTPKEYGLLLLLLRQQGQVLSRAQIFENLYDSRSEASDKVVEVIVSTLRGKLARYGADERVQTRRGFGYVLTGPDHG